MGSLTFRFAGVCTHFREGIVPGVPHRVVLGDLTKFQVGSLKIDGSSQDPVLYYTTPHFAQLDLKGKGASVCGEPLPDIDQAEPDLKELLTIPHMLSNGDIGSGVRLQVINATDVGMTGNLDGIYSLRDFFPNYAPSSEVVLKGRASCYLDLFGGCTWVTQPDDQSKSPVVWIRVATDGPPKLLFTPLISSVSPPQPIMLPEDTAPDDNFTMFVKNLEDQSSVGLASDFDQGIYDYLLHYVTAQGGIPQILSQRPPGLAGLGELPNATLTDIGTSFQIMGNALLHTNPTARRNLAVVNSVTPACADSMFP